MSRSITPTYEQTHTSTESIIEDPMEAYTPGFPLTRRLPDPQKRYRLDTIQLASTTGQKRTFSSASIESIRSQNSWKYSQIQARLRRLFQSKTEANYFEMMADLEEQGMDGLELQRAAQILERGVDSEAWEQSATGQNIMTTMRAHAANMEIFRANSQDSKQVMCKDPRVLAFFDTWIEDTSYPDTQFIDSEAREEWEQEVVEVKARKEREQSTFRKGLEEATKSLRGKNSDIYWCPILQDYFLGPSAISTHILFPRLHGEAAFRTIFGSKSGSPINNGILMHHTLERMFDKGLFALVPAIDDMQDTASVKHWAEARPRQYKVHLFQPEDLDMQKFYDPDDQHTFASLHGRVVKFLTNWRPGACFLSYHFMFCLVKLSLRLNKRGPDLLPHIGTHVRAIPGKYLKSSQLLPMLKQIGLQDDEETLGSKFGLDHDSSKEDDNNDDNDNDNDDEDSNKGVGVALASDTLALQTANATIIGARVILNIYDCDD